MSKQPAICTLFEGHYHYGLAALINSLHINEYKGHIYVGYRGDLTDWCAKAQPDDLLQWNTGYTLLLHNTISVHFLLVDTDYHLTNYKPQFMLQLLSGPANQCDSICYFDPDIILKCPWSFIDNWMTHGVAVVHEVIMNDMPDSHPTRMDWKNLIHRSGREVHNRISSYLNGGFCGISKENFDFLFTWAEIIQIAVDVYKQDPSNFASFSRTSLFWNIDQDAFNITAMCCNLPLSEIGPEAMDFEHGGQIMSHAVGSPKPWKKNYLHDALRGLPPSLAEKAFWANVDGLIPIYDKTYIRRKLTAINVASLIGRFYRRR